MSPDDLLALARQAARAVWRQWRCPPWTADDWADLVQEAVADLVQLSQDARYPDPSHALLMTTACNAVRRARRWRLYGSNPHGTLPLAHAESILVEWEGDGDEARLPDEVAEGLWRLLAERRAPKALKAERTQRALRQDVQVLRLLMAGYHNEGIALEMGMSVAWVDQRRQRLKDALAAEALRRGIPPEAVREMRRNPCAFDDFRYHRKAA